MNTTYLKIAGWVMVLLVAGASIFFNAKSYLTGWKAKTYEELTKQWNQQIFDNGYQKGRVDLNAQVNQELQQTGQLLLKGDSASTSIILKPVK